ncbi:hypothetical protein BGZ73_001258 [Actinomortierella ambigua]|nr:hypothetical protein BGZ73_001258 [Actinomortierella ambigua]
MAILALSKPVTTENFDGERIDYSRFDFTVQDQHADACPVSETQSIVRLSNYLTAPFAGDRLAQLRAIFTWIAKNIRYNKTGLLADNRGDNSAEAVLRNRLGVCAGYSNLFMALSAHQGLGVIQVTGDARGDGFKKADEQFLDPPVCADLYVDLPVLRPSAWSTGLRPIPGYMGQVLQADDDFVELDVRMIPQVVSSEMAIPRLNLVWNDSPPSTATMISPFWYNEDEETGDVVYSFRFYCPSHGSGVLHACAPVGAGTTKAGVSLTYKVINNGNSTSGADDKKPAEKLANKIAHVGRISEYWSPDAPPAADDEGD